MKFGQRESIWTLEFEKMEERLREREREIFKEEEMRKIGNPFYLQLLFYVGKED